MPIAYFVTWTEHERGWGCRPDGYSLHTSKAAWDTYLKDFNAAKSATVPDEYSSPDGEPVAVEVPQELADKLAVEGSIRYWQGSLIHDVSETGTRTVREKSPSPPKTFFELCLEKKAKPEEIDDHIDLWHAGKAGKGLELREYLGMTKEEYVLFMQDASSVYKMLYDRLQTAS